MAIAGDDDRVLPMRGQAPVCGDHRPTVVEKAHGGAAQVHHRLDRDRHAGLQARAGTTSARMRDVWIGVHVPADAMTTELRHHTHAFRASEFLDGSADVPQACAMSDHGYPRVAAPPRDLDETPGLFA